ncbi:MAG: DNA adenine methyltransferase YhdJ [Chloroflexi bacterium ADurb.Bin180]|nr:MAG: DNA adenine methyltransferase YhdJ [Chloroflexi bacterium ADurb.Bin180]
MDNIDHIGQLKPDPRNARKHNPRNVGMIEKALGEVGAARSIVIDENNVVLAGNGVLEAAGNAGIERVQVVDADGETIVAVRRKGLTPEQKAKLALYDNRTAELAEWDTEVLADIGKDIDLGEMWTADELRDIGVAQDEPTEDPGPQIDRAEELQEKWQVKRGDVWEIGKHRLMCGDSTNAEDVGKLMGGEKAALLCTDPPYNVGKAYGDDIDDSKAEAEYETFSRAWFELWRAHSDRQIVSPGCYNLARWCRYFDPYHVAPWTKSNSMTNGKVSRFWCWEPVLFFGEKWARRRPNDIFEFPIGQQAEVANHPCPKPLKMWVDLLENYSEEGDIVADGFDGSGTTLVAAEQTGRICYGMEIEPKYCAVTLERLAGMGLEPLRILTNG